MQVVGDGGKASSMDKNWDVRREDYSGIFLALQVAFRMSELRHVKDFFQGALANCIIPRTFPAWDRNSVSEPILNGKWNSSRARRQAKNQRETDEKALYETGLSV